MPAALVCALVALVPLAVAESMWSSPGGTGDWNRSVVIAPFDLALAGTVAWAIHSRPDIRAVLRSRLTQFGVATYAVAVGVALVAHPSWLGLALVLRLAAGLTLALVTHQALGTTRTRTALLATVAAVGAGQAMLALVQSAQGAAFGLAPLDFAGPLYPFGTSFAGRGGLPHPYQLAVLLVVAQGAALLGLRYASRRSGWLIALTMIGAGIGVTYTRAGLFGQVVLVVIALRPRPSNTTRWAAAAIVVGLLLGGTAFGDGWIARVESSAGSDPTSSRTVRLQEAADLITDGPIVGVGPGLYVTAQATYDRGELLPAHNLLAHETAELGLLGALGTAMLLVALTRRAVASGSWALMVAAPMAPFLVLDAFPYVLPAGLALSGVWLALVRHAADLSPDPLPTPISDDGSAR